MTGSVNIDFFSVQENDAAVLLVNLSSLVKDIGALRAKYYSTSSRRMVCWSISSLASSSFFASSKTVTTIMKVSKNKIITMNQQRPFSLLLWLSCFELSTLLEFISVLLRAVETAS